MLSTFVGTNLHAKTSKGKKITEKFVYLLVTHYLSAVSSKRKRSPHILRHSFATHILNNGAEISKVKKMMAICNYAIYEVTGPVTEQNVDWDSLLKPFNEATEISYEKVTPKKTRIIDVKEFVKEPIVASVHDGMVTLTMGIGIYPQGTIKPSEVWNLGKDQYNWPITSGYEIHRKAIMVENEEGRYTPLEINY